MYAFRSKTKPVNSRKNRLCLALLGTAALLPGIALAQVEVCEPIVDVEALGGPIFLLGESVRISADIGAGDVTGGVPTDFLDIDQFSFFLDCSPGDVFPTCTSAGNTVTFDDDITTDCVDSNGAPVVFDTNIIGDEVVFSPLSGFPIRTDANTTCNVQFDVVVTAIANDNPQATLIEILGFAEADGMCSNGLTAGQSGSVSFEISARRAQFRVTKDFSDDNPAGVDVHISCNTGLPLDQSQTISEFGDNGFDSVTFVVDAFDPGELDCDIVEDPVPDGYSESYAADSISGIAGDVDDDADGCHFIDVQEGTFTCVVTDTLDPVDIDVTKEWFGDLNSAGVDPEAEADWSCQNVRSSPTDTSLGNENGTLYFSGNPDTTSTGALYPDYGGSSVCTVVENVLDDAVESDDSDCESLPISVGMGNSCTITNVVFFEGIPTLNQYGLALLALLMLGVGAIGFRRFA